VEQKIMASGTVSVERVGNRLTFCIEGTFDYEVVGNLKKLCEKQKKAAEYVIDLKGVAYINSSAFGAMLYIKEVYEAGNDDISLINASPTVMKMLKMINFDQLFRVV
jgi:HptB-dependent secretion and biofilm anti anti-sigma factor